MNEIQNQEDARQAQLLHSLGRLARGLSALFWGLPATLLICAQLAKSDALRATAIIPAVIGHALLLFGLWQMTDFQRQERPWQNALDRAKLLGLVDLGLCPFLFWYNKMDRQLFFGVMVLVLIVSAVFFLFNLNAVLKQLAAMLPDETLRHETKEFTLFNRWMLVLFLVAVLAFVFLPVDTALNTRIWTWIDITFTAILLFLGLTPLAITMALIWKTKEVIFDGVFGWRR
ncbi:MAG TPA: hypothetical protein VN625_07565 [Desulfuromonadaceae bacterium]|nr:hypothetical protein [Desulfuromonadaceae bacterium]